MKKKTIWALATALLALLATGCAAQTNGQTTIVTSFYPMYVLTLNVTDGIDGVTVQNMAEQNVGCLHDYQLQTRDMVTLEGADALVINGGGMEQFMDKVLTLRADLRVIDASEGIAMFPSDEAHDHDAHAHDEHDEHDELYNAHVWLDPSRAIKQVQNIADGLAEADPAHAAAYQENAAGYIERLTVLDGELKAQLASFAGADIITFHEAFPYFAEAFDLNIAAVIEREPGSEPTTQEIARTVDIVREVGIKALFVEPQYPDRAAETIAEFHLGEESAAGPKRSPAAGSAACRSPWR
mgnify:CR=1 FL=1